MSQSFKQSTALKDVLNRGSKLIYSERFFDVMLRVLKPVSEEQNGEAAVALLLKTVNEDLKILLVKRVSNETDPWSGQMALPGGKRENSDHTLKETVIRETKEETNINLLNHAHFLGVMKAFKSRPRPKMKIVPFVVFLDNNPKIKLNRTELEDFSWISLSILLQHKETVEFSFGKFPAYVVENHVIWGLTYRIIQTLVQDLSSLKENKPN